MMSSVMPNLSHRRRDTSAGGAAFPARRQLVSLIKPALLLVAVLTCWRDGLAHMVGVWASSPTYNHGFLVAPVSVVLVATGWRTRNTTTTWPPALVGVLLGSFLYLVGIQADARIAQHLGITVAIICIAAYALGQAEATRHRFALAFLFFLVPFGEAAVPFLQDLTARGVMLATTIASIPGSSGRYVNSYRDWRLPRRGSVCGIALFNRQRRDRHVDGASILYTLEKTSLGRSGFLRCAGPRKRDPRGLNGARRKLDKHGIRDRHRPPVLWLGLFAVVMAVLVVGCLRFADPDAPRRPAPQIPAISETSGLGFVLAAFTAIIVAGLG